MPIETISNHIEVPDGSPLAGGPLDSLLSPRRSTFDHNAPSSESVAESELRDVGLGDDSDFSMVPLSARQSTASIGSNISIKSTATQVGKEKRRRTTVLSITPSDSSTLANYLHKNSASTASDKSVIGNNTPFILARLESQKEQEEHSPIPHRASVDGQQKLQEEFVRMHNEIKEEEEEEERNTANTGIDWGMYHFIISCSLRSWLTLVKISGALLYRVRLWFVFCQNRMISCNRLPTLRV